MARVVVHVMPKAEILDPQGQAIVGALGRLGHPGISDVAGQARSDARALGHDSFLAFLDEFEQDNPDPYSRERPAGTLPRRMGTVRQLLRPQPRPRRQLVFHLSSRG